MENTPKSICCNADAIPSIATSGGFSCSQCNLPCEVKFSVDAQPANPPEEIKKTLTQWAEDIGVRILDPDGFDRTQPDLMEKLFTKEEFNAGIGQCTVKIINVEEKEIELPPSRYAKDPKTGKHLTGRPSQLTPIMIAKLEEVHALDASVEEICFYCDVSRQTYYNWKEKNPALFDRLEALRQRPILKARRTLVNSLDAEDSAFRYISRKRKDEFSEKQIIAGEGGFAVKQTDERLETLLKNANPEQRAKLLEAVDGIQPEGAKEGAV